MSSLTLQNSVEMKDEVGSFAFASSRFDTTAAASMVERDAAFDEMASQTEMDKMEGAISLNVTQEETDTQIEEIDLTSNIAYVGTPCPFIRSPQLHLA